jgi:predicted nucleotidyltransferase
MMKKILKISKKIGAIDFVERIYLFGSKVNNPEKKHSDIDLCIVINDNSNSELIYEQVVDCIQEEKTFIHPIIFSKSAFENKIRIQVYKESIIGKGKLIYKNSKVQHKL